MGDCVMLNRIFYQLWQHVVKASSVNLIYDRVGCVVAHNLSVSQQLLTVWFISVCCTTNLQPHWNLCMNN